MNAAGPDAYAVPPDTYAAPQGAYAVPAHLPLGTPGFIGRARELSALDGLFAGLRAQSSDSVAAVISGTAGVGRTALAVHWARQVRPAFPDGQLYVNLRGFDPGGTPLVPERALRGFLTELGLPEAHDLRDKLRSRGIRRHTF
ncbi:hypothetical protein [Streptomyces flavofungini]|uniref:hypothetical protein n=1 Tax=Streptomyces flavofungini TaxID=68200 RepID=UPI0034DE0863